MKLQAKQFIDNYAGKLVLAFNLVLVRGLGLLLRRDHSLREAPQHIVVIKILGLGSVFMALDSLYSMKQRYPQAKLYLVCGRSVKDGILPLGLFDEVLMIDDSGFVKMISSALRILARTWRMRRLWVVDLEVYSVLTTIFSSWTLARNRFGFQLTRVNFRHYLNTHNIYFNQFVNVEQNYRMLVEAMGVHRFSRFVMPVPAGSLPESKRPYIAINNTCSELGGNLRKLPDAILKEVCEWIITHTPYAIAFTGAPSDREAIDVFIEANLSLHEQRVRNIAGELGFAQYYRFLQQQCALMVSIDSAPLHIARKLGLATLSLWGPINPGQRISIGNDEGHRHRAYYLGVPCSPCIHLSEVVPCGGNNICMKQMESREICRLINDLLIHLPK